MLTGQCHNCGKTIRYYPSNPKQFCSRKCFRQSKAKEIAERDGGIAIDTKALFEKECPQCGKLFLLPAAKKDRPGYCSSECYNASRRRGCAQCENCGEEFEKKPAGVNRFCSTSCFKSWQVGKNAPGWRGGKSYWRSRNWQKVRKTILERDNYTCQRCGEEGDKSLHVHHIVPWLESHDNSPENLITLCCSCHRTIEYNLPNRRSITTEL